MGWIIIKLRIFSYKIIVYLNDGNRLVSLLFLSTYKRFRNINSIPMTRYRFCSFSSGSEFCHSTPVNFFYWRVRLLEWPIVKPSAGDTMILALLIGRFGMVNAYSKAKICSSTTTNFIIPLDNQHGLYKVYCI